MQQPERALTLAILALVLACASPADAPPKGAATHLGFTFPASVGRVHLQNVHEFDDPSFGAVANYRLAPTDPLIVSVYVFPAPRFPDGSVQPIEGHAEGELRGLLQHYEGARQIEWPEELSYRNLAGREIYLAALEIHHDDLGQAYSLLGVMEEGSSRIKIRISYTPDDGDAALAIRTFFEQFP